MSIQETGRISGAKKLAENLFALAIDAPAIAAQAKPGQFLHIKCGDANLLRRPISICDVEGDTVAVVYQVKGDGTAWLSKRKAGERLDLIGPAGNGFDMAALGERPVLIGGGIGVPPMLYTMKKAVNNGLAPSAILGFRTASAVILEEDFVSLGDTYTATDDGSYGIAGFVTDVLRAKVKDFTSVCACGPKPMLRAIAEIAEQAGLYCQVSMEERMGCGIGACLVCACALKGEQGETKYGHVCKDGPVFDSREVVW